MSLRIFTYMKGCSAPEVDNHAVDEEIYEYSFKNPASLMRLIPIFRSCDLIFDFTEGDSFSDIYGMKRFYTQSFLKLLAIRSSGGLVLGPQTIGPFQRPMVRRIAQRILKGSLEVFARDSKSAKNAVELGRLDVTTVTDVAFLLAYDENSYRGVCREGQNFGLNVSGLLAAGGYTRSNQFGLTVDYLAYIERLIGWAVGRGMTVHLIPHVVGGEDELDSDTGICRELHRRYPETVLAPTFSSPMDAKSYISAMDVFSGARMHSTIAAISASVPVVPFSYSRKFEGLFESLGYRYCIDGRALGTDEAFDRTVHYICSPFIEPDVRKAQEEIGRRCLEFTSALDGIIAEGADGRFRSR